MNNFIFRYPPPPPLPIYTPTPPPPPPPVTTSYIFQPPPPPPHTTSTSWENLDFSRPPPPVVNGLCNSTINGIAPVGYGYRIENSISSPNLSPGSSQENSTYRVNNDTLHTVRYRQHNVKRYATDRYSTDRHISGLKSNFKKPRPDGQIEQRNDNSERSYYGMCDTIYLRSTPISDIRSSYSRSTTNVEPNSSSSTKFQEEIGHRRKRRKRPLSQTVPSKKIWTKEEANMALEVEKEYLKLFKNHSIKIKFPDQEVSREIVTKFHPSIETVFFHQPSNPRFCYITLANGADPDTVVEELNKVKFGLGFLSAEYKKDREEEHNIGPEDIDPSTLYVGNLAREVTKEDLMNFFPKYKRLDIGFAKKMRFTRYAFISFYNVQDSIEAFKKVHYADLHSKSIIARFRRLHGGIGMPGESKLQHPSREIQDETRKIESSVNSDKLSITNSEHSQITDSDEVNYVPTGISPADSPLHNHSDRRTISECSDSSSFHPGLVKNEPYEYLNDDIESYHSENDVEHYETVQPDLTILQKNGRVPDATFSLSENLESQNSIAEAIVKTEPGSFTALLTESSSMFPVLPIPLKVEPRDEEDFCELSASQQMTNEASDLVNGVKEPKKENENYEPNPEVNEEEFNTTTDFGSVLDSLKRRQNFMP